MTAAMLSITADAAELNTNLINLGSNKSSFANLTTQMLPLINSTILSASVFPPSALPSKNDENTQTRIAQTSTGTAATPRKLTTISSLSTRPTTIIMNSKRPTIIIYPTVSPESIVIPIVSCILGFPLLALLVICCLRRRAKLARERDRRRNYDMQDHAVSLVRFSPIHRLNSRSTRAISLRPERSLSRGFPSLELDTVIEERSDAEQTQTDILSPESPIEPQNFRDLISS